MDRSASKFHNTSLKMHRALFRLLERKELCEITVRELCAEAGVNRSTFYSHYSNTNDLLKEAYADRLQEFFRAYNRTPEEMEAAGMTEAVFTSPDYLIPYLRFVRANRRFFKVYMSNLQNFDADGTYSFLMEKVFLPFYRKNGIPDRVTVNYLSKFYLQGITSVALEWVNRDCAEDEAFLCKVIAMCVGTHTVFCP